MTDEDDLFLRELLAEITGESPEKSFKELYDIYCEKEWTAPRELCVRLITFYELNNA